MVPEILFDFLGKSQIEILGNNLSEEQMNLNNQLNNDNNFLYEAMLLSSQLSDNDVLSNNDR